MYVYLVLKASARRTSPKIKQARYICVRIPCSKSVCTTNFCVATAKTKHAIHVYRMQFTDYHRTDNHYYSLSDRTDRNVALTDCISASILDNPCRFCPYLEYQRFSRGTLERRVV